MIPPNGDDIDPKLNAIQALVAVRDGEQWRIAHFVNTPALFDGRPDDVETMTRRLRDSTHEACRITCPASREDSGQSLPIITSVDLTNTITSSPGARPRSSTASRVMVDVIC